MTKDKLQWVINSYNEHSRRAESEFAFNDMHHKEYTSERAKAFAIVAEIASALGVTDLEYPAID